MPQLTSGKNRKSPRIVSLLHDNWNADEEPALVLNPNATLTSHLAWTWSEARALEKIAEKISASDDPEAASTACIFLNRLSPMTAQLDYLISSLK